MDLCNTIMLNMHWAPHDNKKIILSPIRGPLLHVWLGQLGFIRKH